MLFVQIGLTSLFSLLVLMGFSRLQGYRQMSQMTMFDYINGITIGSIAAELSTATGEEFWRWLVSILVYGFAILGLSAWSERSMNVRRAVSGKPIILLQNNRLFDKNFKKAKLDLSEFLMQCRTAGWFDLSQLDTVLFEPNGNLSFLPNSGSRPATPEDLGAQVPKDAIPGSVILDGHVMEENLRFCGYNLDWLCKELRRQNCPDIQNVFLATCMPDGTLTVFPRGGEKEEKRLE